MFFNWGAETLKWKIITQYIQSQSLTKAFQSVLIGVSIGLFTPNRVGEMIGRVYFIDNEKKVRASLLNLVNNTMQVACTFLFGILGLIAFKENWIHKIPFSTLLPIMFLCSIAVFALYYVTRYNVMIQNYFLDLFIPFKRVSRSSLVSIFILSVLRYFVFTFQFVLVLQLFQIQLPMSDMLCCIALNYLLITIIPTYALAEVGVRGSVAAAVFGVYGISALPVMAASLFVWCINLALPALAGSFLLMKE